MLHIVISIIPSASLFACMVTFKTKFQRTKLVQSSVRAASLATGGATRTTEDAAILLTGGATTTMDSKGRWRHCDSSNRWSHQSSVRAASLATGGATRTTEDAAIILTGGATTTMDSKGRWRHCDSSNRWSHQYSKGLSLAAL